MVNPHVQQLSSTSVAGSSGQCETPKQYIPPLVGWQSIKQAFKCKDTLPSFNNGHIVSYFVTRSVLDGLPSGDFKSINCSAEYLFRCGHVQKIEVCSSDSLVHIQASCLPEMKKDRVYSLNLALNDSSYDIVYGKCGCPAGMGPSGSCKHIGALCYAISDFCKYGSTPDFLTSTDKLQSWNKPRGRKVQPIPVEQLSSRRSELLEKPQPDVVFDPRPEQFRYGTAVRAEKLRISLLNAPSTQSCALLTILVPSIKSIQHDHPYALPYKDGGHVLSSLTHEDSLSASNDCLVEDIQLSRIQATVHKLCISDEQRLCLEASTREQNNELWHRERRCRITGSKCGRILNQKKRTEALLKFCLYPRPFDVIPKQIVWGRDKEPAARQGYIQYMRLHGHPNLKAKACGFFVHPEKGWLGASPDADVNDPDSPMSNGIAELKCPFLKADVTVEEACQDTVFYCTMDEDDNLELDRSHQYYHQVQLQLYVSGRSWCDFCVYTCKNVAVERIYPDTKWQQECIPTLDSYFFNCMLPELVYPKIKPGYYL